MKTTSDKITKTRLRGLEEREVIRLNGMMGLEWRISKLEGNILAGPPCPIPYVPFPEE